MFRNLFTSAAQHVFKDRSSPEALAAHVYQAGDTASGRFATELEKLAIDVGDPGLQALLNSSAEVAQNLLDTYSNRPNARTARNGQLGGFSAARNVQKFVVTYKTPIMKAKSSGATLGGQSVGKPTNNVSNVAKALTVQNSDNVDKEEIMSALGVVVRETVLQRVNSSINEKSANIGGQTYSARNAQYDFYNRPSPRFMSPYRRNLQSSSGELFQSDFQVSLHMDVIECDLELDNPFYYSSNDSLWRSNLHGMTVESEMCLQLQEAFQTDNLVESIYVDEVLTGQAQKIDPVILQSRIDSIERVARLGSPSDPLLSSQWIHGSENSGINSSQLWRSWAVSPPPPVSAQKEDPIIIALIDSGVDYLHKDLIGSIWQNSDEICNDGIDNDGNGFIDDCYGWNFVDNSNDPMDDNGHGTAAAGIIAASPNNDFGIAPVCWNCAILPIKALDENIKGTVSGFIKSLNYALLQGARISNNSYGGQGSRFGSLEDAVQRAEMKGLIFVAASGNFSCDADQDPAFPASYRLSNVVSVAAHNIDAQIADFSCYGRNSVAISAPGEKVLSLAPGDTFKRVNGTSFAAPVVSGILGMMLNENRGLSHIDLISILYSTVKRSTYLQGKVKTGGMVDMYAAVSKSRNMKAINTTSAPVRPIAPLLPVKPVDPPSQPNLPGAVSTTEDPNDGVVICLHDLCPHKALCLGAERVKASLPQLDSNRVYNDDIMACRCPDGHELIANESPPNFPWAGDIGYCRDIDECSLENQCGEKSGLDRYRVGCHNTDGGFECRCKPGFTNMPSDPSTVRCVDIDECQSSRCPVRSRCVNLPGNHECACVKGYYWDSVVNTCKIIDPKSAENCRDPRVEVWGVSRCYCRVGYTRNKASPDRCVRAGVLESVASSIYDSILAKS